MFKESLKQSTPQRKKSKRYKGEHADIVTCLIKSMNSSYSFIETY